ncbi:glycosyltransferase family 2 protein [Paenibacillus urinalis]|uniref:glycosyltransferase family 2 protein n=1 Tax=Paenibacillus urinalis TaxID=521520 RepID=UPI001961449F
MARVQILLSTFNGENYIRQQIESILNQSYPNIEILIRDDGSIDNTVSIIESYINADITRKIKLIKGSNIGVVRSFFELLYEANQDVDYFCFCDQDDIWLPQKVETAVERLNGLNSRIPLMHFTPTYPSNDMQQLKKVWPIIRRSPSFCNAIIENVAVGSTITFNLRTKNLIVSEDPDLNNIVMHDWWLYIIVSSLGKVVYSSAPSIVYRQHTSNVIGADTSLFDKYKKKWSRFKRNRKKRYLYNQAYEFYKHYNHLLSTYEKLQLESFLRPRNTILDKLNFLFTNKFYRQTTSENLMFRFLVLIGYI